MPLHDPLPGEPSEPSRDLASGARGQPREADDAPPDEDVSSGNDADLAAHKEREAAPPDPAPDHDLLPLRPSTPASSPSRSRRPGPPLLASQALIEDLAPVEPLGQHARILCVVAGLLFGLFGALPLLGVALHSRPALIPSLVVGAVTLFAAVARVTYRKRAVAMVALGAIVAGLGIAGTGPAEGTAEGGALWSLLRFVAASVLPAALLFRARYRAFERARVVLGLAFLVALPFAIHAVSMLFEPAFGFVQVGALLALVLLAAGLPGFMGSETTAAGSFVAPAMIVALALQAGLQRLGALVPGSLDTLFAVVEVTGEDGEIAQTLPAVSFSALAVRDAAVTAVTFAASVLLSALGLFQILAWKFAPAARQIDVRRTVEEVEERPSIEDWSTRG